jgi:type IV pilus assembly protein PilN
VYLKSLKQAGNKISLVGYAQSNARVSTLMRSIEDSPWLDTPNLVVITATTVGGARLNEFSLTFNLTQQVPASTAVKPTALLTPSGEHLFLASLIGEGVL